MLTQTSPHSHVKTHKTKEGCLLQVGSEDKEEAAEGKFALCLCWNAIFHHSQTSISKYISYILTFIVVIGFVASTLPELEMLVQMACSHEGRPFHDLLHRIPNHISDKRTSYEMGWKRGSYSCPSRQR
jgi:hypothetical protein